MTERKELLRGEIAVGKLVAEKHAHDCGDGKRIQDPRLLPGFESEAGEVAEDQRKPRAPDEEFQNHHEEEFEADCFVHRRDLTGRVGKPARASKQRARSAGGGLWVVGWWLALGGHPSTNNQQPTTDNHQFNPLPNCFCALNLTTCGLPSKNGRSSWTRWAAANKSSFCARVASAKDATGSKSNIPGFCFSRHSSISSAGRWRHPHSQDLMRLLRVFQQRALCESSCSATSSRGSDWTLSLRRNG